MPSEPTVLITGASSGVGLAATRALARRGWHVLCACRDLDKTHRVLGEAGVDPEKYTVLKLDLASLDSVRELVPALAATGRELHALVCNAAVYLPLDQEPRRSAEGYELSVAVNHLGHFLLVQLLHDVLVQSSAADKRVVILGTVTANRRELGGRIPIPTPPDLGDLEGLRRGFRSPISMIDGGAFDSGKAYKDSKLCNLMTTAELHRRYHRDTGITYQALYPGCVADTALFRHHYRAFQRLFPLFQRKITGGYVSQEKAGERVADVVSKPELAVSGVYWSWGNRQRDGTRPFHQPMPEETMNLSLCEQLWRQSMALVHDRAPEKRD